MHHTGLHIASSAGAAGVSVAFPNTFHIHVQNSWKFTEPLRNTISNIRYSRHFLSFRVISSCLFLICFLCTHERLKTWCALCCNEKLMPRLRESQSWPLESQPSCRNNKNCQRHDPQQLHRTFCPRIVEWFDHDPSRTSLASAAGAAGAAASVACTKLKWRENAKPGTTRSTSLQPLYQSSSLRNLILKCLSAMVLWYNCTILAQQQQSWAPKTDSKLGNRFCAQNSPRFKEDSFCKWMPPRLESPSRLQSWPSNVEWEKMGSHMKHVFLLSQCITLGFTLPPLLVQLASQLPSPTHFTYMFKIHENSPNL